MAKHIAPEQKCTDAKATTRTLERKYSDNKSSSSHEESFDESVVQFGLNRMCDIDPVKCEQERKGNIHEKAVEEDAKIKRLLEILPVARIQVVRSNPLMMQHLLGKGSDGIGTDADFRF